MSVLRSIDAKIEGLFEGVFGRAFRTHVQPVELARKLAKEMDDHKTVSVSRVYVPNEYTVYLGTADREQFDGYEGSLLGELEEYLAEHAKREKYALLSRPKVLMENDEDLGMGEFGIATRMVQPRGGREGPPSDAGPGATMIYKPKAQETEAVSADELGMEREVVSLTYEGKEHRVEKRRVLIGRSKECDIQLADTNVSRRHAELRQEGATYWAVDLDSTNGMEVNGRRTKRGKLSDGDTFTLGSTDIVFSRRPE